MGENDRPQDIGRLRELAFMRPPSLLRVPDEVAKSAAECNQRLLWAAPDQIEDHLAEGYEFVEKKELGRQPDGTTALDTRVKSREMVLMKISEDLAQDMEAAREYRTDLVSEVPMERLNEMRDRIGSAAKQAGYSNREVDRIMEMFEIKGGRQR